MEQAKEDIRVSKLLEQEDIDACDLRVNTEGRSEEFSVSLEQC